MVFTVSLTSCSLGTQIPTNDQVWSGYHALVTAGEVSSLPPYDQIRQEYTLKYIGTGETTATSYEAIRQCAPPTLASREGRITGARTIVDLVPIKGSPEERITLYFIQWQGTREWWVKTITETSGLESFTCVQVPLQ